MSKKAIITISGQVQRVGYRYWVYNEMQQLDLVGKAENQIDDTVRIEVEGTQEAIKEFAHRCRKGPPLAEVAEVTINWQE